MLVNDEKYYSLQMLLFKIQSQITALSKLSAGAAVNVNPPKESFKMATSVITMGPIIILYPFLQKPRRFKTKCLGFLRCIYFSMRSLSLNRREMHHTAAMPTSV